jgi:hypothetical protein
MVLSSCCSPARISEITLPPFGYVPLRESTIVDKRAEFAGIFCQLLDSQTQSPSVPAPCSRWLHLDGVTVSPADVSLAKLQQGKSLRLLIVPGIFGECVQRLALPFQDAFPELAIAGVATGILMVEGRSDSAHNAGQIAEALSHRSPQPNESLVLVGYSKGTADIIEALAFYPDETKSIAAVVSIAGVVNGSPAANDVPDLMRRLMQHIKPDACPSSSGDPIESLTYAHRQVWLNDHRLPEGIKYFSVVSYADPARVSAALRGTHRRLRKIDDRNDGQLIYRDEILPGSTLLAAVNADHWAVALPLANSNSVIAQQLANRNDFPRTTLMLAVAISVQAALASPTGE